MFDDGICVRLLEYRMEVIVCDNESSNGSIKMVKKEFVQVICIAK